MALIVAALAPVRWRRDSRAVHLAALLVSGAQGAAVLVLARRNAELPRRR
jgi:hypothetical protein